MAGGLLKDSDKFTSDTKQCPYCAETIKANAIVCRFCGKNLSESEDRQIIDDFIRLKAGEGWQVLTRSESNVQLRKPKQMNRGGFILGLLTLPLWGLGIIIWILTVIGYFLQDEPVVFYTAEDIKTGAEIEEPEPYSMLRILAITIVVLIAILITIALIANLLA